MKKVLPRDVSKEMIDSWWLKIFEMIEQDVEMDEAEIEKICDAFENFVELYFGFPGYNNCN